MFGNFMLQLMQYVRRNNPEIVSHTNESQEIIQSFLFFWEFIISTTNFQHRSILLTPRLKVVKISIKTKLKLQTTLFSIAPSSPMGRVGYRMH